jgi:rRNA maturation endonuclease Nob1
MKSSVPNVVLRGEYMPVCRKCGYQNKEENNYCVNCGSILEITEEHVKSEKAREWTAIKNYISYFLIF